MKRGGTNRNFELKMTFSSSSFQVKCGRPQNSRTAEPESFCLAYPFWYCNTSYYLSGECLSLERCFATYSIELEELTGIFDNDTKFTVGQSRVFIFFTSPVLLTRA